MSQAYQDVGMPIGDRIARMKQSIMRLEALQRFYPDLTVKSDPMKDIYQSKEIWKHADTLEVHSGQNTLKVLPCKDIEIIFHNEIECNTYKSSYRIYTNPMDITLLNYHIDFGNKSTISLSDTIIVIQIQNYMSKLEEHPYTDNLLKQIEDRIFANLEHTIIKEPHRYKIENDHFLPEKLQTLITFL